MPKIQHIHTSQATWRQKVIRWSELFYSGQAAYLKGSLQTVTLLLCLLLCRQAMAQINERARYEIDAKRIGTNPEDKDALPRSREFIRLDSTYYVGWMYEGLYKYDRSSDYLGYQQAIAPLEKALRLFEKDYGDQMRHIFSSMDYFRSKGNRFNDFYYIATTLQSCYNSIEMPDSTMALLEKLESYQFQRDFFYVHTGRAWLYHRNRFYTSEKHPFLGNSIEENEALAFRECYTGISEIEKRKAINDLWYGPYQSEGDLLNAYHYLAILHDYNENYDSSRYYYELLVNGGQVSWSNYANMEHVVGDFAEAIRDYSKVQYKRRFSLSESDYFMPMILVYGGDTKNAIRMAQEKINESGSTPGFGWYNIALARSYLYDGQLDSCGFFLDKAANFKELHINTTLTQSVYEFTINLLRIQLLEKKVALIKFLDTGWWYSPSALCDIAALKIEKILLEYAVVNSMAANPERERLIYNLFCAESTFTYDESLYLLKDFCSPFFQKKYEHYTQADPRRKINRYFRLFACRFLLEGGNDTEAEKACRQLLDDTDPANTQGGYNENAADMRYEKLYLYRVLEMLSETSSGSNYDFFRTQCFKMYPQQMLYSGIPARINIHFSGLENDERVKAVMAEVSDCNIEFTESTDAAQADVQFHKQGDTYQVMINVTDEYGAPVVVNSELLFKESKGIGAELAMRLFGKGGAVKPDIAPE